MIRKQGFTLLEVVIATVLLVIVLGPFLSSLLWHSKKGEDTEKMQMAIKVLQSVKEELNSVRFKDFVTYATKNPVDEGKDYLLDDMFFPESKKEVINFQSKYRDFDLAGSFKFVQRKNRDPKEKTMISAHVEVKWGQPETGIQSKTLSLTLVDPKS